MANASTTTASTTKRIPAFQAGLEKLRDPNILQTCHGLVEDMNGFDMLYINMPWKSISMDYAAKLPVANLVKDKDHAGLLLWVDSPCVNKANTLLDTWGFKFHSVLHVASYVNPTPTATTVAAAEETAETTTTTTENEGIETTTTTTTTTDEGVGQNKLSNSRKSLVPHGWTVNGIVPSRSRQLWFAVRNTADDDITTPYLKDASFIRKRVQPTSTFEYSKTTDGASTTLSSKKKNLDNWMLFPEYDAYVPLELRQSLETIHRPNARVLSMFSDSVNRNWYTWGPNVPGYVSGPLRQDGAFPIVSAMLKYFSPMKGATVQKYLTLMNLYAVQSAKQLGSKEMPTVEVDDEGKPREYLTPLVTGRMQDFFEDLLRKHTESGGPMKSDLAEYSPICLDGLVGFREMSPIIQTQILLLGGQVIRSVLKKNADATERRKRAIKRKREMNGDDGALDEPKPRIPRKFGIAAPVDISKDMASFMGLADGEKVARTTVVKYINEYIGKHKLQNPEKKSEIEFDEALQGLFNPSPSFGPVTYFNLWKLMGPHFLTKKKTSSPPPSSEGSPLPARQPLMPTQGVA